METLFTPSNIMFALGLIGILFSVYLYFREPQIKSQTNDALMEQQMKWFTDSVEKRFQAQQENFNQLLLQSNNHIHTVDTKVEALTKEVVEMGKGIVRLATTIEERIPRK
jgi:hypothetical protein